MVSVDTARPVAWVAGLPLDAQPGHGPRLEWATRSDTPDPFVAVDDGGRHSRSLLARLATGPADAPTQTKLLAIRLRRDRAATDTAADAPVGEDNPALEAAFHREHALSQALAADSDDLGLSGTPITWCRKVERFFEPPCPRTGTPLRDCRDDAWLADRGLETWTGTTIRFLRSTATDVCYTATPTAGARPRDVVVRRGSELFRDLRDLVRLGANAPATPLVAAFPCMTCEHRATCHPERTAASADTPIPAERHLVPLSFHETQALCTEALPLRYDELCDILGGAPLADVVSRAAANAAPGRAIVMAPLTRLTDPVFLHGRDDSRRLVHEMLWTKLDAFARVGAAVERYHAATSEPHLGLSPDNLLVKVTTDAIAAPLAWRCAVRLADLGAQSRTTVEGRTRRPTPPLPRPMPDAWPGYRSRFAAPEDLTVEIALRMTATREPGAAAGTTLRIDAEAVAARIPDAQPGDVVRFVAPPSLAGLAGLADAPLVGVVVAAERTRATFRVELADADADADPQHGTNPANTANPVLPPFQGRVTFHRRLGTAADVHALAMLLARTLLVNDRTDPFRVEEALTAVVDKLEATAAGVTLAEFAERARAEFVRHRPLFDSSAMLFPASLRDELDDPLAASAWNRLLLVILRGRTTLPGIAYATHHAATGIAELLADVAAVARELRVDLFERERRDGAIRDACTAEIERLHRTLLGGAAGAEARA